MHFHNVYNLPLLQQEMENRINRRREPLSRVEVMQHYNRNVRDRRDDDDMFERVDQPENNQQGCLSCLGSTEGYKQCIVMVLIGVINIAIAYMLTSESKSVRLFIHEDQVQDSQAEAQGNQQPHDEVIDQWQDLGVVLWILALGFIATLGYVTNFCLAITLCKQIFARQYGQRDSRRLVDKIFMAIAFILAIASTILPIAMITVGIKHVLRASSYMRSTGTPDDGSMDEEELIDSSEMLASVITSQLHWLQLQRTIFFASTSTLFSIFAFHCFKSIHGRRSQDHLRNEQQQLLLNQSLQSGLRPSELARLENQLSTDALADLEKDQIKKVEDVNLVSLDALKSQNHTKNQASIASATTEYMDAECSICMAPLKELESIYLPGCKHLFHKKCVYKWLIVRSRCPLCQRDVRDDLD